jgi:hypothetical protein
MNRKRFFIIAIMAAVIFSFFLAANVSAREEEMESVNQVKIKGHQAVLQKEGLEDFLLIKDLNTNLLFIELDTRWKTVFIKRQKDGALLGQYLLGSDDFYNLKKFLDREVKKPYMCSYDKDLPCLVYTFSQSVEP